MRVPPAVTAALLRQDGVITRIQALDGGLSPEAVQSLVRVGEWVRLRRGLYAESAIWAGLDPFVGRPRLLARGVVMTMRRAWFLSHDSAAHELGLDILTPDEPFVHVTRPGFTNAWTENGVKHHLARFASSQVVEIEGRGVLDIARTAVDIARERESPHGLVACDSAMRMGVTREQLWEAAAGMTSWPFITRVKQAIEDADPGAQTVAESQGRDLVNELGIGTPETQFPLRLEDRVVFCDLRIGNHVFEIDGRIKYRSRDRGGAADRPLEEIVWEEKKRERLIRGEGLGLSRLLAEDFYGAKRSAARRRLLAEYAVTVDRFGTDLHPHLRRNADRLRAQPTA